MLHKKPNGTYENPLFRSKEVVNTLKNVLILRTQLATLLKSNCQLLTYTTNAHKKSTKDYWNLLNIQFLELDLLRTNLFLIKKPSVVTLTVLKST